MIRILLASAFLILYLLLTIPVLLVLWIVGKWNRPARDMAALRMVQWAFHCILFLAGVKADFIGEERVPQGEAILFVCNHRSFFDILLTYTRFKGLTGYVAKKEMRHVPLLNIWMRFVYCLFLDRENPKEGLKTILGGIDQIKRGISMAICPEGTRNKGQEGTLLPFKAGALKMAEKSGCAIVPVAINNSAEIFENHLPFLKSTHVIVEYCQPIYPKELEGDARRHLAEHCQRIIQETIDRNAKEV